MSELISRDALIEELEDWYERLGGTTDALDNVIRNVLISVMDTINDAETVDAVEVVRCKDCAYWTRVDKYTGKCPFLIGEHQYACDDHYCSCGERREEDGTHP